MIIHLSKLSRSVRALVPATLFVLTPALFLAAPPTAHAAGKVIFSEDFEGCDIGENISKTREQGESRWRASGAAKGESLGQSLAAKGKGQNGSTIAITTPAPSDASEGNGGTTYNITSHFPDTGGTVRLSLDVFPESGSGQIMVRPRSGNPSDSLALIQFRAGKEMAIRVYTSNGQGDKAATNIGRFRFHRWYKVTITLHLSGNAPTYDVEIADATNPDATVTTSGLECPTPANTAGNLLLGSIFSKEARFGWDNILVEKLD